MADPTSQDARRVGFIGLGAMGSGIAHNLHKYLQANGNRSLYVWNRTLSKADDLVSQGATLVPGGPSELSGTCDIIFSMLFDDASLLATADKILSSAKTGLIWVDCTTVDPAAAKTVEEKARASGVTFMCCPVFGRPDAAREKRLVAALAGDDTGKVVVQPYVESFSRAVMDLGDEAYKASQMKLMGNFFILSSMEMIAEAQCLADKTGLARDNLLDFIDHLLPAPLLQGYAARIASDNYTNTAEQPGFSVTGALKDITLIRKMAADHDMTLPITDITIRHLERQKREADPDMDMTSAAAAIRLENGLKE
ncbi:3-hydroxyisobutyrate dehydrogenase family protein [Powellomyces hirtus]|nr:3-hydroxyisobutyrate dehydrogenase family protein [Powellomyces hirtus]